MASSASWLTILTASPTPRQHWFPGGSETAGCGSVTLHSGPIWAQAAERCRRCERAAHKARTDEETAVAEASARRPCRP